MRFYKPSIKQERFRAVFYPAVEVMGYSYVSEEFPTYEQAQAIRISIADYTLLLSEYDLLPDYSNTGLVEQFVDGEWVEFDPEDKS